ncbi:MAG: choice-of-anchor B family protein, partial [Proteobacteria bacterium]|nr:choice-of-anchor B family protein [Pseudomonadota bacterium]
MSIREPFSLKSKLFQASVLVFIFTGLSISSLQAQISMNVELLSNIDFAANAADIWGYVDSEANEYAIIGLTNGTAVVNITNPEAPDLVGTVAGPSSLWRDIKTFSHFAYVVEDQTPSVNALQIIDLSDLPNSVSLAATYNATFSRAHNLYIDEDNGFAYVVGGDVAGGIGGISRLSLANPTAPVEVSKYSDNYVHDIFVRNDTAYASAIFSGKLQIIKFSDFVFPILLTEFNTVPHNFTHNAWTTEDGRIVATTDEAVGGTLKLWDISDLGDIDLLDTYSANASAIIHNVHIKGALAFVSYYTEGLRIVDISDPGNVTEAGFYDTWPGASGGFNGAWGVYPFLPSGNIIVSDIESGLFVFALTGDLISRVTARAECPENVRQGCSITTPVTIDVSQTFPEEALGAYNATLTWNPSLLDYVAFSGGPAPFDNPIVNEDNTAAGELSFEQSDAAGVGGV